MNACPDHSCEQSGLAWLWSTGREGRLTYISPSVHPNAVNFVGKPLAFYMGDDSRGEYIYKFVTAAAWDPKDIGGGMAAGDKYLNEGKLYVARFDADGRGQWIELTIQDPRIANYSAFKFENQGEVYLYTRHAADAVGATKMDRPEWAAVNPKTARCMSP